MPDQDWIVAVGRGVGGPADAFRAMTQQQYAFQLLYRVKATDKAALGVFCLVKIPFTVYKYA